MKPCDHPPKARAVCHMKNGEVLRFCTRCGRNLAETQKTLFGRVA